MLDTKVRTRGAVEGSLSDAAMRYLWPEWQQQHSQCRVLRTASVSKAKGWWEEDLAAKTKEAECRPERRRKGYSRVQQGGGKTAEPRLKNHQREVRAVEGIWRAERGKGGRADEDLRGRREKRMKGET